jgi:hypothetical protein
MTIREVHRENGEDKVSRYINGLRYDIQYGIIMMKMINVEDAYQVSLKA